MDMNPKSPDKKKKSVLSFIWPYLVIAGVVIIVLYFIISGTNSRTVTMTENQTAQLLMEGEVEDVTVLEKETVVYVTGSYVDSADNKTKKFQLETSSEYFYHGYKYEYDIDNDGTPEYYTILDIISTRTKADGTAYYTTANYTIKNYYESNWFTQWLPYIIIIGVSIILVFVLLSRLNASVNASNNKAMDFNKSRARREDTSKYRFEDVAGCDEEKAELVEMVDYLKNPRKYSRFGAKLPKGVLLVGPPGTGKTLLAKAVAGEAHVPFFSISGSDFVELYVGVGAGRVRDMFKKAKQNAPCLVFIDEIDAVGRQRGTGMGGGNDEREQTLNALLVEMDGFADNSGIIVMAATNRDDVLDPALLRAGRFDRKVMVNLPNEKGRADILNVHARNKVLDPKIDFKLIAKRTVGFSGADLEQILNDAAILAVRWHKECVTMTEIDEAIDRRMVGIAKNGHAIAPEERKQIAYHEAGHAIIGLNVKHSAKVQKITIIPRGHAGGYNLMNPEHDQFILTKKQLLAEITGLLGGRVAEEIFFGDVSTGASNDIERATQIARSMVVEYGMSSLGPIQYERNNGSVFLGRDYNNTTRNFSAQVANEIDAEIRKIIDECHNEANRVITEHKDDLVLIAETLLSKDTIVEEEISYLLEHRVLPSEETKVEEAPKAETQVDNAPSVKPECISAGEANIDRPKKRRTLKAKPAEEETTEKGEKGEE